MLVDRQFEIKLCGTNLLIQFYLTWIDNSLSVYNIIMLSKIDRHKGKIVLQNLIHAVSLYFPMDIRSPRVALIT
jgi:hypothetical protein